jgi:outer membrane immunogenic protein
MKLFYSILGLTLASVGALASANAQPYPITPVTDWSGPYAGVHIGGAWGAMTTADVTGIYLGTPGTFDNSFAGVFGGAQLGYNFQFGTIVVGPEVEFGGIDISHRELNVPGLIADSVDGGFYADVTGRIGVSIGCGLLYTKGGFIYLSGSESHSDAGPPAATATKNGLDGWTLGGGYEYRITPSFSVKAEYVHSDFGSNTFLDTSGTCISPPCPIKDSMTVDTAKVGVNYFFNNAYVPLK